MRSVWLVVIFFISNVAHALNISGVTHSPKFINPAKNESVSIQYALDVSAKVTLNIYDDRDVLVRKISSDAQQDAGMHKLVWDGRDQANRIVPAEAYRYTLVAENSDGSTEFDLSDFTGGYTTELSDVKWDMATEQFSYRVLKPSRVSIRIGLKNGGPLLATLADWLPRGFGAHHFKWNGFDNSNAVNVGKLGDYEIYAQAFALSDNTILVGPEADQNNYVQPSWKEEIRQRKKNTVKQMQMHSQQYAEKRGDFKITITLPDNLPKTKTGVAIIKDVIPVRFTLSFDDQRRITNDRYEPILFIDGVYQAENEAGFFPMTWNWNPKDLAEGEHYITVNLRGYEGHFGAASVNVFVKH